VATVLMYVGGCIGVYVVGTKGVDEATYALVKTISVCWFGFMSVSCDHRSGVIDAN
jgi:hypothetical protein